MLKIVIPDIEEWDEKNDTFISVKGGTVLLEHSLESLSKWEGKHHKAFLSRREKTTEEVLDYVRCMCLNIDEVDPGVFDHLTQQNISDIQQYIEDPMSAVYFMNEQKENGRGGDTMTAEMFYFSMINCGIPFECQKWHLNRLMALIRVIDIKTRPAKSRNKKSDLASRAALNEERRKLLNTKG